MGREARISIRHVAREAGVSTQTVSRVINDRPDVSRETRSRVQAVIARLGYRPSAIARSLVSQRTRTLGLITSDFGDYFFTQVIAGAEREARERGYFLMLSSTEGNPADEPVYVRLLTEYQVAGLLLARPSADPDSRHVASLLQEQVPVVTAAYYPPDATVTVVDVDSVDGARQMAAHLVALGHRAIAMITGPATWKATADRTYGFQSILNESGISFEPALVVEGDWSHASGYRAANELLTRGRPFSAVFAQNDQMAIGCMRALRDAGHAVPQAISVAGYDDIPSAAFVDPPLTTIHMPMQEVGATAIRLLIEAIEHEALPLSAPVVLPSHLVQRQSCVEARHG